MRTCIDALCDMLRHGKTAALATLVACRGSAPREPGAALLADESGLIRGTVGGGAAEAAALSACREVLADGNARLLRIAMNNDAAAAEGMACGGTVTLWVEAVAPTQENAMLFDRARDALARNGFTFVRPLDESHEYGHTLLADGVFNGAPLEAEAREGVLDTLARQGGFIEPAVLAFAGREYFVASFAPPSRMIIAGGGHVAVPTARIAALAGFAVHVLDDRPEFALPERFPDALSTRVVPEFADCFSALAPTQNTFIVIVTRGHRYDGNVLAQALATEAGYIGMIGSRKKRDFLYAELRAQGVDDAALERVQCPIGLSIGARTPEEIAVSIVAECIAHKRNAEAHGRV